MPLNVMLKLERGRRSHFLELRSNREDRPMLGIMSINGDRSDLSERRVVRRRRIAQTSRGLAAERLARDETFQNTRALPYNRLRPLRTDSPTSGAARPKASCVSLTRNRHQRGARRRRGGDMAQAGARVDYAG